MPCPCQEPSLSCSLARNARPRSMLPVRRSFGGWAKAADAKTRPTTTQAANLTVSLLSRGRRLRQAIEVLTYHFRVIGAEARGVILDHLGFEVARQLAPVAAFEQLGLQFLR